MYDVCFCVDHETLRQTQQSLIGVYCRWSTVFAWCTCTWKMGKARSVSSTDMSLINCHLKNVYISNMCVFHNTIDVIYSRVIYIFFVPLNVIRICFYPWSNPICTVCFLLLYCGNITSTSEVNLESRAKLAGTVPDAHKLILVGVSA